MVIFIVVSSRRGRCQALDRNTELTILVSLRGLLGAIVEIFVEVFAFLAVYEGLQVEGCCMGVANKLIHRIPHGHLTFVLNLELKPHQLLLH